MHFTEGLRRIEVIMYRITDDNKLYEKELIFTQIE